MPVFVLWPHRQHFSTRGCPVRGSRTRAGVTPGASSAKHRSQTEWLRVTMQKRAGSRGALYHPDHGSSQIESRNCAEACTDEGQKSGAECPTEAESRAAQVGSAVLGHASG